ncbi:hypothetical protein E2P63_05340 [Candidatus Bathyarchaeota archaeon]|nr:hypothetical protein E2P63_05340 [Candidatus Bathyarchaeota archaeon]
MTELTHFGILGMKWGVRRKGGKSGRVESADSKTANRLRKKSLSELSNAELKTLTQRMQLEQQYKSLSAPKKSRGQKVVEDVLSEVGKDYVKNFVASGVSKGATKLKPVVEAGVTAVLDAVFKKK